MNGVTAESYTLRTESGQWLGQVVLTSDGMYASVTSNKVKQACQRYAEHILPALQKVLKEETDIEKKLLFLEKIL